MIAVALFAACAAPAAAQLTADQVRAKTENAKVVIRIEGGWWRGRLVDIDAETVTIQPKGAALKTLRLADVLRIDAERRDSPGDGALAGAVIVSLWCLLVCGQGLSHASDLPMTVVMNASMGAMFGAMIDAGHKGSVALYKRPPAAPPRRSAGLFFTVRF